MDESIQISKDFCFVPKKHPSIKVVQYALENYYNGLENALDLNSESNLPIFLDANVLLDYYKISFTERKELERFLIKNQNRLRLTRQIEKEFLNHRVDHIKSYLNSINEFVNAYRNITVEIEKLKEGEIKGFDAYVNKNKILNNDHQDLKTELSELNQAIKYKLKDLFIEESSFLDIVREKEGKINEIKKRLEYQADIERDDPLLRIISNFYVTDDLLPEEISFLEVKFGELGKELEQFKSDQKNFSKFTFPGCGDRNKKDYPFGDFIIYHELLKFMKKENTDVIFLTNDTEKNDWLLRIKSELVPFIHYIVNTFANTKKTLYIFQARDKIRLTYSPVYTEDQSAVNSELNNLEHNIGSVSEKNLDSNKVTTDAEHLTEQDGQVFKTKISEKENYYPNSEKKVTEEGNIYDDENREYSKISRAEFLKELKESQIWARNYGSNFVGLRSFVVKYLGNKGFDFRHTYKVKEELEKDGLIQAYTHRPEDPSYNEVEAIKIVENGN